jgi:hypothetical protein
MCMELFVASDVPLPLIAYDPTLTVFSTQVPLAGSEPVLRLFPNPMSMTLVRSAVVRAISTTALGTWKFSPRRMYPVR